jgi:transposase
MTDTKRLDLIRKMIAQWQDSGQTQKAFAYSLRLWHRLKRFVEDGKFQIGTNPLERPIRPLALGRKNYLFAGLHDAAQNAAVIHSLLTTCKVNDEAPFQWLKNVLTQI